MHACHILGSCVIIITVYEGRIRSMRAMESVTYAHSKKCLLRSLLRCMKKVRVTS